MELLADESFHLPMRPNEICINAVKSVMTDLKTPSDSSRQFCCWIITELSSIVHAAISSKCTRINKEVLWPKLYQLQISASFAEQWCSFLTSLQVPREPIFYHHYTGIIFNNLVKESIPNIEEKTACVISLTFEEENAIYYVGSYVLKCLTQGEKDEELLHGFNHLIDTGKGTEFSSDMWIKEINQGGQTNITEEAHQVFLSIEFAIRTHLKSENLHKFNETLGKTVEMLRLLTVMCLTGISIKVGDASADMILKICFKNG